MALALAPCHSGDCSSSLSFGFTHPPRKRSSLAVLRFSEGKSVIVAFRRSTASCSIFISTVNATVPRHLENLVIRHACDESELSASAFLRARSFYNYPEGRSIQSQKTHQKYMAESECKTLLSKLAGTEAGYNRVACLIALFPLANFSASGEFMESCKVTVAGQSFAVVGTLDVNQGLQLPGEIQGLRPKNRDPLRRAYISNFCVAQEVRRMGVGMALVERAKETAIKWGVSDFYVHVVTTNEAALKLYRKSGFVFEAEETVAEAHLLQRPRRMLLWFHLDRD